jgi:hypothetical protein
MWTGINRDLLRRGVLHADLTTGPKPCSASHQTPLSGAYFSSGYPTVPMLLQFPPEILKVILGYLEPIWLFQVAAAYHNIHELLDFETSNRVWYDAIPAALLLEPENFQDEVLVNDRMEAYSKGLKFDTTFSLA